METYHIIIYCCISAEHTVCPLCIGIGHILKYSDTLTISSADIDRILTNGEKKEKEKKTNEGSTLPLQDR